LNIRYGTVPGWSAHLLLSLEEQATILEWIVEHQDEVKGFRSGICLFFYQVKEDTANRGMDMVSVDRENPLLYVDHNFLPPPMGLDYQKSISDKYDSQSLERRTGRKKAFTHPLELMAGLVSSPLWQLLSLPTLEQN
jgi:hypothetical protein